MMEGVIYTKRPFEFDEQYNRYIDLHLNEASVDIEYYVADASHLNGGNITEGDFILTASQTFDNEILFQDTHMVGVYLDKNGELVAVNMSNIYKSRGGKTLFDLININTDSEPLIIFKWYLGKYVIISSHALKCNLPYIIDGEEKQPLQFYIQYYGEDYVKAHAIGNAKRNLLVSMDPNQSLAYIEAQLDMVTRVLCYLLDKNPDIKASLIEGFPELPEFMSELLNSSVFNIKTSEKCLEEIKNGKSRARDLQKAYYHIKDINRFGQ